MNFAYFQQLIDTLIDCWKSAEQRTIDQIADGGGCANEVNITYNFRSELRRVVDAAAKEGRFEAAFAADLVRAFPEIDYPGDRIARGLIASVHFHDQHHEGRSSAADLGIVLTRPSVSLDSLAQQVVIDKDCRRGLLAQAKLGKAASRRKTKWGELTEPQIRLLPELSDYYSLLLYQYTDLDETQLAPFQWQLCRESSTEDIRAWLRTDEFPHLLGSEDVIRLLDDGQIGTRDEIVIDQMIGRRRKSGEYIEIRVHWRDGEAPPEHVAVYESSVVQHVKQSR